MGELGECEPETVHGDFADMRSWEVWSTPGASAAKRQDYFEPVGICIRGTDAGSRYEGSKRWEFDNGMLTLMSWKPYSSDSCYGNADESYPGGWWGDYSYVADLSTNEVVFPACMMDQSCFASDGFPDPDEPSDDDVSRASGVRGPAVFP